MKPVTKDVFLTALSCMTKGWYLRGQGAATAPSEADQFRMEQGIEIGRYARSLFPDGVLIPYGALTSSEAKTKAFLDDKRISTLFEATFSVNGYVAKPDILNRANEGWE